LQKVLGKPGKTIGGNLSTVGATVKRFEGKRRPIQTNYSRKLWTMDPDFANAVRAIS
jgi:hypothetical protein